MCASTIKARSAASAQDLMVFNVTARDISRPHGGDGRRTLWPNKERHDAFRLGRPLQEASRKCRGWLADKQLFPEILRDRLPRDGRQLEVAMT